MEKLYEEYGRLVMEAEFINTRINTVKRQIFTEMQKSRTDNVKQPAEKPNEHGDKPNNTEGKNTGNPPAGRLAI